MEIIPLTADQWGDGGNALKLLWLSLLFAIIGSGSFITAHAVLPSAIATGTVPPRLGKLRPLFYALGFAAVVGIAVNVVFVIDFLDYLEVIFGRRFR
ncbi:MAG: hypothetical protein IH868_08040 [Chloroflexi bacterium]|nr:hypothetical protein [Chloroflexota bacterium]MCH8223343.1 hypothetical protein [Chloroflexota bacterium]